MSTQLIGFSIGGVARRFLVQPPSMIWPINLVNCALFNTLHQQQYAGIGNHGGINRDRFFLYIFLGSFFWCEYFPSNRFRSGCLISCTGYFKDFFPGYICESLGFRLIPSVLTSLYSPGLILLLVGHLDSS